MKNFSEPVLDSLNVTIPTPLTVSSSSTKIVPETQLKDYYVVENSNDNEKNLSSEEISINSVDYAASPTVIQTQVKTF